MIWLWGIAWNGPEFCVSATLNPGAFILGSIVVGVEGVVNS